MLRDSDWSSVHITERAISFDGRTYNLKTDFSYDMPIPKNYYGFSDEIEDYDENEAI